jgi:cellulose biosynthesis protein BcsQ
MKTVAFFNNKGGVGKTSLVYHVAWMLAAEGIAVVAADLDPQANLTSMFVDEDRLELFWPDGRHDKTVYGAIQPLLEGTGDVASPYVENISENLGLIIGDLALSGSESELNSQWPEAGDRKPRGFRVLSAIHRTIRKAAQDREAEIVLIDVGPNLGAINRAALITAEYVIVPLAPDIYSLQGMRNLGPTLAGWRNEWAERLSKNPVPDLDLPMGTMKPIGYIVMQHAVRLDRPVRAYGKWMERIPNAYRQYVLGERKTTRVQAENDEHCLAMLKHYRSLMPMAQEARKPMFRLKPADGAIGAHVKAVQECYKDFRRLARRIRERLV